MRRWLIMAAMSGLAITVMLPGGAVFASSPSSVLPPGFRVQSQSWVSPMRGWLLGASQCGTKACAMVAATNDGGATWREIGVVPAHLGNEQRNGVTEIRFADVLHGWAFDPALWATTDGGRTWTRESPPGRPTVALAGDAQGVYRVVSACPYRFTSISACKHDTSLWRTTPSDGTWTRVPMRLPKQNQAFLSVFGRAAYLLVPAVEPTAPDALDVTVDGRTWSPRPDPCDKSQGEYLSSLSAASTTEVALLCQSNIGFGKAEKRAFRSNDAALTTVSAGELPLYGINSQIAMAPNGVIVVATYSIGSWIYRNAGGQTWTTPVDGADGGMGWNDVLFTTNRIGWVVHGPASCCGGLGAAQLGFSDDGGVTWNPV